MGIWIQTFISVLTVSLISLVGVFFLSLKKEKLKNIQLILVGFATGGLLGGAFFHLLPESFESFTNIRVASLLLVAGFMLFFILVRLIPIVPQWELLQQLLYSCMNYPRR